MKKRIILIIIAILIILLFPIRFRYKDGGTLEYRAILYRIIKWNTIEGYKDTEIHFFPNNFHSIDYYKPLKPYSLNISNNSSKVILNIGSYSWTEIVDGKEKNIQSDSIHPVDFKYSESLDVIPNQTLIISQEAVISRVEIYNDKTLLNKNAIIDKNTIKVPILEKGTYTFILDIKFDEGEAIYSFKANVID